MESDERLRLRLEAARERVIRETGIGADWSEKGQAAFAYGYARGRGSQRSVIAGYCAEHGQDDESVAAVILGHYSGYCAFMRCEPRWDDVTRAIPAWQSIGFDL